MISSLHNCRIRVDYCARSDASKCVLHHGRRRDVESIVARLPSTTTTTSGRPSSSSSSYFWRSPVGLDHHTVVGLVIRPWTTARAIYGRVATHGHFAEFHHVVERANPPCDHVVSACVFSTRDVVRDFDKEMAFNFRRELRYRVICIAEELAIVAAVAK